MFACMYYGNSTTQYNTTVSCYTNCHVFSMSGVFVRRRLDTMILKLRISSISVSMLSINCRIHFE